MRLRSHIISVVIPLIVAPIIILGWLALEQLHDGAEERLLAQLVSEIQKITIQSESEIQSIEKDLEILSTFSVVERYLLTEDEESRYTVILPSLLKLFRTFQETHDSYYEIKVLWTDGYEDARSALLNIDNATEDESNSEIFKSLTKGVNSKLTRFILNPDTNALALVAGKSMSVIDRARDPISSPPVTRGYLLITSSLAPFEDLIVTASVGTTGKFFITNDQGGILYHPDQSLIDTDLPSQLYQTLASSQSTEAILSTLNGQNVYLTHTSVRNKLHIFGQLNADEVLASADDLSRVVFILIIVSTLITFALVYLALNRMLIFPIRKLGIAVKDMQYGEFTRKINIQSNNELGDLARAFENMGDELQKSHNRIHALAYYDELTKLPNRSMFKNELLRTLSYCKRRNLNFALMFIDIDNFKHVNDVFGHQAGDELLMIVSARLKQSLREEDLLAIAGANENVGDENGNDDIVARLGGDEFIILIPNLPSAMTAHHIGQRIINALCKPITIQNEEVFVGASIGIALYPNDGETPEALLKNADLAMYHAKSCGKNQLQFYGDAINIATTTRHHMENRLRKAIQNNLLEIYYQPILSLDDERIIAAEALLRWHDEELGFVPPDKFIAIAEDSGMIMQLGEWVLTNACKQNQSWHMSGLADLTITVNVSGIQITRGEFEKVVEQTLQKTGLNPHQLCLEITETSVVSAIDRAQKVLKTIRQLGVKIALDDFGTGYSSLSYLRKLPIDHIKIDRSFISDISEDEEDETIISAIIAMGKNLDMKIVAEGIETQEQLAFLKQRHCEMGQGYLFSKPIRAADFERFAREKRHLHNLTRIGNI